MPKKQITDKDLLYSTGNSAQYSAVSCVGQSLEKQRRLYMRQSLPRGSDGKASACDTGESGLIPELGGSPGGGKSDPLQYSCLENSIDRGAWQATVHGVAKDMTEQQTHMYKKTQTVMLKMPGAI